MQTRPEPVALTSEVRDIRDALSWLRGQLTNPAYLEIGVCEGGSLLSCINSLRPSSVTLVDSWGEEAGGTGRGSHAHIEQLLAAFGYGSPVTYLDGDSKLLVPTLPANQFDLALVDGDHNAEPAMADLVNTYLVVKPGGWLLFDDLDHAQHPYLRTVWERFAGSVDADFVHTTSPHNGTYGFGLMQKARLA